MWFVEREDGFTRRELLSLYRFVESREKAFREELYRFVNFYSAVCYAVLGLTLSGFLTLYTRQGEVSALLLFGPMLALMICGLGVRVSRRTYRRIVEEIAMKGKIEHLLGLDGPIEVRECKGSGAAWKEDESVLPIRHAKRRLEEDSSASFVRHSSRRGIYGDLKVYFGLIASFSVLLAAVIVGLSFLG